MHKSLLLAVFLNIFIHSAGFAQQQFFRLPVGEFDDSLRPFGYSGWETRRKFIFWASEGEALMEVRHHKESNICFERAVQLWLDPRLRDAP